MEPLGTIEEAEEKVLSDVHRCLSRIKQLAVQPFETAGSGVSILRRIRSETYEDLNQIQHEYFVLRAAQWLLTNRVCEQGTMWWWNPRQTGTSREPDLQGRRHNGDVVLAAEITTSESSEGKIDTRMRITLTKLSEMEGARYYFVCTDSMRQRANTKVARAGWPITVVMIPDGGQLI